MFSLQRFWEAQKIYNEENKKAYNLFRDMNGNILVDGWKDDHIQLGWLMPFRAAGTAFHGGHGCQQSSRSM